MYVCNHCKSYANTSSVWKRMFCRKLKTGRQATNDKPLLGALTTVSTDMNMARMEGLLRESRQILIKVISKVNLGVSIWSVHSIIHKVGYSEVCGNEFLAFCRTTKKTFERVYLWNISRNTGKLVMTFFVHNCWQWILVSLFWTTQ